MHLDPNLLLPLAALILGGLFHSLSADGAASILDHFSITWRLPAKALPIVILLVSVASYTVDARTAGSDWQRALIAALTTAFAGIFGAGANHAFVSGKGPTLPPGAGGAGAVLIGAFLAMTVSGCAWWQANGKTVTQDALSLSQIACIESSQFTSAPEVATACSIDSALVPVLEQLLAQKAAAHRSGFSWDAGAPVAKDAGAQ